jgi:hypothetical protein
MRFLVKSRSVRAQRYKKQGFNLVSSLARKHLMGDTDMRIAIDACPGSELHVAPYRWMPKIDTVSL